MKFTHLKNELSLQMRAIKPLRIDFNDAVVASHIRLTVSEVLKITIAEIESKSRKREGAEARFIIVYLIKKHTTLKLKPIAKLIGNRDHSTVIYNNDTAEDLKLTNAAFRNKLNQVEAQLNL